MERNILIQYGIHVTHNDADAVGCALALSMMNRSIEYKYDTHFCCIGNQDSVVKCIINTLKEEDEIRYIHKFVISDISLSEETCKLLSEFCFENEIELIAFDHHKTNNLDEIYSWWKVIKSPITINGEEREISAAKLLFEYMYKTVNNCRSHLLSPLEYIVNLISDYDTWEWRRHPATYEEDIDSDIAGIVCKAIRPKKMYNMLYDYLNEEYSSENNSKLFPKLFYELYEINKDNTEKYIKYLPEKTKIWKQDNLVYAMIFCENEYTNAGAESLYTKEFIDVVVVLYPANKRLGFRTNRDDLDLGKMAKEKFGGGGHLKASGCQLEDNQFVELSKLFYLKSVSLAEYVESLGIDYSEEFGISRKE